MDSAYALRLRRCWTLILFIGCTYFLHIYASDATITSTMDFNSDCVDGTGTTRFHMDKWVESSVESCNERICYVDGTKKYKLMYDCPVMTTNVDPDNCRMISNTSLPFPGCCKALVCDTGTIDTSTDPPCSDRHAQWVCDFWKAYTGCAARSDPNENAIYDFTIEYCRLTCGYCSI